MTLITCQDASFAYEGAVVLEGVSFQVNEGDYLCIVGENGSGKSTLIKGILRLKSPRSGSVILSDELKANEIGFLPQQTAIRKDFPASVYEVALSGRLGALGFMPFYRKADKCAAYDSLARMGVFDLKDRCFGELSAGQRQRVLLARALCGARKLLVMDEPVAGLDPLAAEQFYSLTAALNHEMGIAVVMVSHDILSVAAQASHILHLNKNQVFFGPAADYAGVADGFLKERGGGQNAGYNS